jgi:hypothetical protein
MDNGKLLTLANIFKRTRSKSLFDELAAILARQAGAERGL